MAIFVFLNIQAPSMEDSDKRAIARVSRGIMNAGLMDYYPKPWYHIPKNIFFLSIKELGILKELDNKIKSIAPDIIFIVGSMPKKEILKARSAEELAELWNAHICFIRGDLKGFIEDIKKELKTLDLNLKVKSSNKFYEELKEQQKANLLDNMNKKLSVFFTQNADELEQKGQKEGYAKDIGPVITPEGWIFVATGNAARTRRIKSSVDVYWTAIVKRKVKRKMEVWKEVGFFLPQKDRIQVEEYLDATKEKREKARLRRQIQQKVKINDYLTLTLENGKTQIYINHKLFTQCKYILFQLTKNQIDETQDLNSIDEIANFINADLHQDHILIPAETEFWGHLSNLQVWVEHNYDTRLLHSNLAFPLLKRLKEEGDPLAMREYKEEIIHRFIEGSVDIKNMLIDEYFNDISLTIEEIDVLLEKIEDDNIKNRLNKIKRYRKGIII